MSSDSELLSVRDFSLRYGDVQALRGVDFAVGGGEIVGVVGESGCGKSSLLHAILRLLPGNAKTRGGIYFAGRDLCAASDAEMRAIRGAQISVVFQEPMRTHNPVMTIGRQMADIQYRENLNHKEKLARAAAMLRQVEIPDAEARLGEYPAQFSGGMLQRIAIAMALLSRPQLLIADEPTTALDATLEVRIIELLKALQREVGCAILFISHHLGVVAELCSRVAVMYAGEVVEAGALREVFAAPRHPYTRRLLACDPGGAPVARRLPTIPGEVPDLANLPAGCAFAPRCDSVHERCGRRPPVVDCNGHRAACWLHATDKTAPGPAAKSA